MPFVLCRYAECRSASELRLSKCDADREIERNWVNENDTKLNRNFLVARFCLNWRYFCSSLLNESEELNEL